MITQISSSSIRQTCAICQRQNLITISSLQVGSDRDERIIRLPGCSCGAVEGLNRTFDNPGEHARAVNSLWEFLASLGKVNPNLASAVNAEKAQDKPTNKVDLSGISSLTDIGGLGA